MNKAEFYQGRLVRCLQHDYKVHQKGLPTHKDCPICAVCRIAHELETSMYAEDIESIYKFAATFGKTKLKPIIGVEKDERPVGEGDKGRRRRRVSRSSKKSDGVEDGDGVGTGPDSLPE